MQDPWYDPHYGHYHALSLSFCSPYTLHFFLTHTCPFLVSHTVPPRLSQQECDLLVAFFIVVHKYECNCCISFVPYSSGIISITVLPLVSVETDESEEMFTVSLTSTTNDVVIDPTLSSVTITVRQNGSPLGVVSFLGEDLGTQRVNELAVPSPFVLSLERDGDNSASVDVSYTVTRIGDDEQSVELDVVPASGTATFPVLQGRTTIVLTILADQIAEIDEAYSVQLVGANNGATINPQANTANFIIK